MNRLKEAWFRRSVRFRIATMATAATLIILLALAWFSGRGIGGLLISSADRELQPILDAAIADVAAGRTPHPDTPYVQVRVLDTAGTPQDRLPDPGLKDWALRDLKGAEPVLQYSDDPPTRWIGTVVTAPDGQQRLVVAGAALAGYEQAQHNGLNWLLLAGVLGAAATGIATWFAVRSSLRPVERMRRAAAGLPAGQRLPLPDSDDELRSLAESMNALLDRRDEATERLRRFTGDAAHELRSPVASIRVQAEVAVANPDPVLSQEVLADIVHESVRLSTLVDGLLTLARSDAGELPTAEPVDLVASAEAAISRCASESLRVTLQAPTGTAWVLAAPAEVDLVLDNLLRNAVLYARAHVTVAVLPAGGFIRLIVDDDGPGVAPEHREKVFDRFYRVQDDRARQTGGSGLGLALVAELVRRRGGSVLVTASPDGGARFQVRWKSL